MCFENEETTEIIIQGLSFHEARDFDGELIGLFSNCDAALAAQKDCNIKKMVIKKELSEERSLQIVSCRFTTIDDDDFDVFIVRTEQGTYGPDVDLETLTKEAIRDTPMAPGI